MLNAAETTQPTSAAVGTTRPIFTLLRLEGLAILITAAVLYAQHSGNWGLFALLLLTPDLAFVVYALNKEAGRHAYNAVHFYGAPLLLGAVALLTGWAFGLSLVLIWVAHIALDRLLGYGLKYTVEGKDTHMQRV